MKVQECIAVSALSITTLAGGMLTQLMAQAPKDPSSTTQAAVEPVLFKDYQAGLREAKRTDKPLFVVFRCER